MTDNEGYGFDTLSVHAGVEPDPTTGAIMTPIYATSTYIQTTPGEHKGYEYSRTANPTRHALEKSIAALEGARFSLALSSGCSGTDVICHLLNTGDHIVSVDDVYGGTSRLFRTVWSRHGVETTFCDFDTERLADVATATTKLVWIETPTNPMLKVINISDVVEQARKLPSRPWVVVDNTFASPFFQRPLSLGADIVLHSTTKYLNGHSDVVGGALAYNDEELHQRLHHIQNSTGGVSGAFDSWLVLRGIKTLGLRMKKHQENAIEIADWLERHPRVEKVLYPGLKSHPQHDIAREQMTGFGGMITVFLKGGIDEARKFLERVQLFALAESLGGVESLIEHPAIMTHASIPAEMRAKLGIKDNLVRLSIGIEEVSDLKKDLSQALAF